MDEKEVRKHYGWNKSASPNVIVDRKKKRFTFGMDENFNDVMGVEKARREKAKQIPIDPESLNPVHRFLTSYKPKDLLNRKAWFVKGDGSKTFYGRIVNVLPPGVLLVKCQGTNLPMTFSSCIDLDTSEVI